MSDIPPFRFVRRQEQAWDYQQSHPDFVQAELRDSELEDYLTTRIRPRLTTVCTSTTRPTSPQRWDRILETDTGEELVYYGATTLWQRPWGETWGFVTSSSLSVDSTGFTGTLVDLGLSATFNTVGSRRYKVTLLGAHVSSTVGNTTGTERTELRLTNAANNLLLGAQGRRPIEVASILYPVNVEGFDNGAPAAGSVTYKVRGIRDAGTGTHTLKGSSITCSITVEDVGPNGLPPAD